MARHRSPPSHVATWIEASTRELAAPSAHCSHCPEPATGSQLVVRFLAVTRGKGLDPKKLSWR